MHTTGRIPLIASPVAKVTACCSAMPTSKKRSGYRSAKPSSPVEEAIAAVMATTLGSAAAASSSASPKRSVQEALRVPDLPVAGSKVETPWKRSILSASAGP